MSLQILLNGVRITNGGVVGVLSEFSQCSASSQEIPALVEGLLDMDKPLRVFGRLISPQSSLFVDQTFDLQKNLLVVHFTPLSDDAWIAPFARRQFDLAFISVTKGSSALSRIIRWCRSMSNRPRRSKQ